MWHIVFWIVAIGWGGYLIGLNHGIVRGSSPFVVTVHTWSDQRLGLASGILLIVVGFVEVALRMPR